MTEEFNNYIVDKIKAGDVDSVINYESGPEAMYAVPTPEHYLPIIYCMGAAGDDDVEVYNNVCNLGSMAMTSFVWG